MRADRPHCELSMGPINRDDIARFPQHGMGREGNALGWARGGCGLRISHIRNNVPNWIQVSNRFAKPSSETNSMGFYFHPTPCESTKI